MPIAQYQTGAPSAIANSEADQGVDNYDYARILQILRSRAGQPATNLEFADILNKTTAQDQVIAGAVAEQNGVIAEAISDIDESLVVKAVNVTTLTPGLPATAGVTKEADGLTFDYGMPIQDLSEINTKLIENTTQISDAYRLCDVNVDEAISITKETRLNIPTYTQGTQQIETATVVGTITGDGNATVEVSAYGLSTLPISKSVAVVSGDNSSQVAEKIRISLNADADITALFSVSGADNKVILTKILAAQTDPSLNISVKNGSCTGLTNATTSASTIVGSKDEIVHPSILFFPNKWNGYKYWMGYTSFDNGDNNFENPCMAVSDDNATWVSPPGLANPIEAQPVSGYNADVCLFMSPDEKTMYMVFKYAGTQKITYLRSTSDGVNWASKIVLFSNAFEDVSPSVVWDGTQYLMWTVKHDDNPNGLYLRTSASAAGTWSNPIPCTYTFPDGSELWHLEVRRAGNQYHMLTQSVANVFYFGKSDDGIAWIFGKKPIFEKETYQLGINTRYYKSTMFPMITPEGLKYGLWYNTSVPYYVCYSEISFDRTKRMNDYKNKLVYSAMGLSPYLFCDTFNRADTAAGLTTSTSGHTWTKALGNDIGISGGKAYLTAAANTRYIYDIGISDFYAEITISALGNTTSYMLFRYVDTSNYWRVGQTASGFSLYKFVATVGTYVNAYIPNTIEREKIIAGDRLGVKCYGDIMEFYRNDKLIFTLSDAANKTGTKIGINVDNTTARFDNIFASSL